MRYLCCTIAIVAASVVIGCSGSEQTDTASQTRSTADTVIDMPSLQEKLDDRKAAFAERATDEQKQVFSDAIDEVRRSGLLDSAISEGDRAPMFVLPDADGDSVSLAGLLENGPVVVSWYRGGWCPYCSLELAALRDALPAINDAGATLVAISPEPPDSAASTVARGGLPFIVLSDIGNDVAHEYGIVFTLAEPAQPMYEQAGLNLPEWNATGTWELPLAATYIIDTDGTVRYAFLDPDYRNRAEPSKIVHILRQLQGT